MIGARDYIDQMLVKKYANEKVDNHNIAQLAVPADQMLKTMNDYAGVHKGMLSLQNRLKSTCRNVNTQFAYQKVK